MEGAQGSHFTSVSEQKNLEYVHQVGCPEHRCNRNELNMSSPFGEDSIKKDTRLDVQLISQSDGDITLSPPDMMGRRSPYHMELTMAGPFYPETITKVYTPYSEACPIQSPHRCVKEGKRIHYGGK